LRVAGAGAIVDCLAHSIATMVLSET
jgi:hypothetical protein